MCSSGRPLCTGSRQSPSAREGSGSGSQYALCALGVGLVALGVVMIVWSIVPADVTKQNNSSTANNGSVISEASKTSSVAFVLVGTGAAMLLLAICLGIRNRKKRRALRETSGVTGADYVGRETDQDEESAEEQVPSYDVPTYEEAVTSGQYPVRQSNLRQSYQLPSYEDLIGAVENESQQPREGNTSEAAQPALNPKTQPSRSSSRASRLLRPLRVRRIKSEKLHTKDIRLNIQESARVTIEPLTPPPQYEDKAPPLPIAAVQ